MVSVRESGYWIAPLDAVDSDNKFFRLIADEIHEKRHEREQAIWINLVARDREDWLLGDGKVQQAPKSS